MIAERPARKDPRRPTTFAINLEESWQSRWWSEYFGVTRSELLAAIMEVGVDADAVRRALKRGVGHCAFDVRQQPRT